MNFIESFEPDFTHYTHRVIGEVMDEIGQIKRDYTKNGADDQCIEGLIVNLRRPQEFGAELTKTISEHVLYSNNEYCTKKGDQVLDDNATYEVVAMKRVSDFGGEVEFHAHYLKLIF